MDAEGGHLLVPVGSSGMQECDNVIVTGKLQLLCLQAFSSFSGKARDGLPDVLRKVLGGMGGVGQFLLQPFM